jgi:hypothetical protein
MKEVYEGKRFKDGLAVPTRACGGAGAQFAWWLAAIPQGLSSRKTSAHSFIPSPKRINGMPQR